MEAYLAGSGLSHTILQPTAFMETHAHMLVGVPILEKGKVALFGRGETPRNFVAAADVADFAVLALRDPSLAGETLAVGGPEDLTHMDVVRLYERLAGRAAKSFTFRSRRSRRIRSCGSSIRARARCSNRSSSRRLPTSALTRRPFSTASGSRSGDSRSGRRTACEARRGPPRVEGYPLPSRAARQGARWRSGLPFGHL